MIGIPVAILGLAAGVYLLLQVKHYGFGGIYRLLAWLVVLLSLVSLGFCAARGVMHHRNGGHCSQTSSHCDMNGGPGACPYMKDSHGQMPGGPMPACCAKDSGATIKCDAGKPACCQKGATTPADSTTHK